MVHYGEFVDLLVRLEVSHDVSIAKIWRDKRQQTELA